MRARFGIAFLVIGLAACANAVDRPGARADLADATADATADANPATTSPDLASADADITAGATDLLPVAADLGNTGAVDLAAPALDSASGDTPDLASALGDLTSFPPADGAGASADLTTPPNCPALPALPGTRVYVAADATGTQTGSQAHPYATITAALATAVLIGDDAVVVIAAGTYDEELLITTKMRVYGGVDRSFACLSDAPTVVRAVGTAQPALRLYYSPAATIERLTLIGNPASTTHGQNVPALWVLDSTAILRELHIETQRTLDQTMQTAKGLFVQRSNIEMYDSTIRAGKAFYGSFAVSFCSSELLLERVAIENRNLLAGASVGVRDEGNCTATPSHLRLFRSTIAVASATGHGLTVATSLGTIRVYGTAITTPGANARALVVTNPNQPELLSIQSSTLVSGGATVEAKMGPSNKLELIDSILVGASIFANGTWSGMSLSLKGTTFLFASTGTIQSIPALPEPLVRNADEFRAAYDADFATSPNLRFDDPELSGYHLEATSPAKNLGTCEVGVDLDGDTRGTVCDVGADEIF